MSARIALRTALSFALILASAAAVAAKTGTPGPVYFAGSYQIVGRTAGQVPVLQNAPASVIAQGSGVVIKTCSAPDIVMSFGPAFEIVNLMTGDQAGDAVECLFHNNGYNRPILTCRSDAGGAFTLWPMQTADLVC
jgi:hypothetical protein